MDKRNNNSRRNKRFTRTKRGNNTRAAKTPQLLVFGAGKQYPGEVNGVIKVPGSTQIISTGSAPSFLFNYLYGNLNSQCPSWSDIANTWDYYTILMVKAEVFSISPTVTGSSRFWQTSENTSTTPTVQDAEGRLGVREIIHNNANSRNKCKFKFVVQDVKNLVRVPVLTDYAVGSLNGITNSSNFGTTAINSALFQTRAWFILRVSGRKG